MKNTYALLLVFTLSMATLSCTKELQKINNNPNASQNAEPDYLLTAIIKNTADSYWGVTNNLNSSLLFVQYWSKIQYTDPDRYIFTNNDLQDLWNTGYTKSIVNLNELITIAEKKENNNYEGVALVLRSWVFQLLTDAYGDIPYTEAVNISKNITPAYDAQKDVYENLLKDLKHAQELLDQDGKPISGDIIYNNNIDNWKKFANSLRLRIALRIADREPDVAKQALDEIKSEGGSYINSNAATAQLNYLTSPNQNPVSRSFETRDDYRISKSIVDKLFELSDPRLPVFAAKTKDPTPKEFVGIPNGLLVGDASSLGFSKTSKPGDYFRQPQAPAVILSYSESLFDRAEAAARSLTDEDPQSLYYDAIRASFDQYGISSSQFTTYAVQQNVQYDPADFKKSIGNQKWIALFGQGLEAFAEWRRLDYPQLNPAVAGTLEGKMPLRFLYPGNEQSLNGKNYHAAIGQQGADVLTTRLWFDVQ